MCGHLLQSHLVLAASQRPTPQPHPPVLPAFRTGRRCASRAAVRVVVPHLGSPGSAYWGPLTTWSCSAGWLATCSCSAIPLPSGAGGSSGASIRRPDPSGTSAFATMDSMAWPAFSVTMSMNADSLGAKERRGYARCTSSAADQARSPAPQRQAKQSAPLSDLDVQLLPAASVAAILARWGILQARVVQLRHRAGTKTAWRQPSGASRQRPPAVRLMARCLPVGAAPHRSLASPQPGQLRRQRPDAVLQILQVSAAVERPPMDAAGPAAPIAGLRGARRGIVGLRPAGTGVALAEPGAGRDGDLSGPAGLPATHEVSPPLT